MAVNNALQLSWNGAKLIKGINRKAKMEGKTVVRSSTREKR